MNKEILQLESELRELVDKSREAFLSISPDQFKTNQPNTVPTLVHQEESRVLKNLKSSLSLLQGKINSFRMKPDLDEDSKLLLTSIENEIAFNRVNLSDRTIKNYLEHLKQLRKTSGGIYNARP